jgi:glycosyltransferase involved in cell wall biosynthesis
MRSPSPTLISIIVPVYNSMGIVGETLRRTFNFLMQRGMPFEIIAVNDGSGDDSWAVLRDVVKECDGKIKAINLLKNSGQHSALLCGLLHSKGDWVVTLDDDMQIPPEEIGKLMEYATEDVDLVVGKFKEKRHPLVRRLGSQVVQKLNERIFGKPADFTITSFRMMRREVVERILKWKTPYPYLNGLMLLCSSNRVNVLVEHQPRTVGKSGYGIRQIMALIFRILFNYSAFPLRFVLVLALIASAVSFAVGAFFVIRQLLGDTQVSGWTTIVALMAFFNSFVVVMLAMIGEYILRLVRQVSNEAAYTVKEIYTGKNL